MRDGEEGGDARAHRIAHDKGLRDAEMIEEAARILGHDRCRIGFRIIELAALRHGRDCRR